MSLRWNVNHRTIWRISRWANCKIERKQHSNTSRIRVMVSSTFPTRFNHGALCSLHLVISPWAYSPNSTVVWQPNRRIVWSETISDITHSMEEKSQVSHVVSPAARDIVDRTIQVPRFTETCKMNRHSMTIHIYDARNHIIMK